MPQTEVLPFAMDLHRSVHTTSGGREYKGLPREAFSLKSNSERKKMDIGGLIGFWLVIALFAAAVGGRGAASKVLATPFRFSGWMLRGILNATGQGARTVIATLWRAFVRVVSDAHRHLYRHWPGATILGYTVIVCAASIYFLLR